jgi:SOS-response transcriptional repressor LexA
MQGVFMVNPKDFIIWRNVEVLLKEKGWLLTDLAKAMRVTPQSINSMKSGIRGIGPLSLKKLSLALNVKEIQLLAVDLPARLPRPIPVISWVQAGAFTEVADIHAVGVSGEGEPVHSTRIVSPSAFGLRVEGDSMSPRYLPGDIIVVDPALKCDNNCPCVVVMNGEAVFKMFYESDIEIIMRPLNPKYPDIVIKKGGMVDFRVAGKVIDLIARL